MIKSSQKIAGIFAAAAIILLINSVYIVEQTQQALVLAFGKPVRVVQEPGLRFKAPFIQNVMFFDNRLLGITVDQKEVIASDRKRLVVDAYVRYRITDPLRFTQTVADERIMENRLNSIVESSLRQVLGRVPLSAVISTERTGIMEKITEIVNAQTSGKPRPKIVLPPVVNPETGKQEIIELPAEKPGEGTELQNPEAPEVAESTTPEAVKPAEEAKPVTIPAGGFGVEVVDVRIMRADLPPENSKAIFRRMQTEREREAKEFRSTGEEEAQGIRARADRTKVEIVSKAQKDAETLRGQGDAEAIKIFSESFGKDAEFFNFYRSMQAYKRSFNKDDTTLMLSPDSEFLKYMDSRR